MQRTLITIAIAAFMATMTLPIQAATAPEGIPVSGKHYTLNLIGMEREMPQKDSSAGHRIFVPLWGECRIDLSEGRFGVTDNNCSDGTRAGFQLPNPDPEDDGWSSYRVYVRALGKPGGEATLTTCREDSDGKWCSTETVVVARAAGHSPSFDVSKQTLTVCHDKDGDGTYEREHLFEDENAGYYWTYQNSGLRLAQLRFYPDTPTDISGPCPAV